MVMDANAPSNVTQAQHGAHCRGCIRQLNHIEIGFQRSTVDTKGDGIGTDQKQKTVRVVVQNVSASLFA